MSPAEFSQAVAAEVRAEMARQKKTPKEFAAVLTMYPSTAAKRLSGEAALDMAELATVALWLGVSVSDLIPVAATAEAVNA